MFLEQIQFLVRNSNTINFANQWNFKAVSHFHPRPSSNSSHRVNEVSAWGCMLGSPKISLFPWWIFKLWKVLRYVGHIFYQVLRPQRSEWCIYCSGYTIRSLTKFPTYFWFFRNKSKDRQALLLRLLRYLKRYLTQPAREEIIHFFLLSSNYLQHIYLDFITQ